MNLTQLQTDIRYRTNQSSTTLPDSNLNTWINQVYKDIVQKIVEVREDYFTINATADLVNAQQNYSLPTDLLKIRSLELKLDGTNWYQADRVDRAIVTDLNTSSFGQFDVSRPKFDIVGNNLYLYPIPTSNVTAGMKLWYIQRQTDLSAGADTPAIDSDWHYLIVAGVEALVWNKLGLAQKQGFADQVYQRGLEQMSRFIGKRDLSLQDSMVPYEEANDYIR